MKTDMFGKEITVGSVIVYPNRRGSSTEMRYGRVERLDARSAVLTINTKCGELSCAPEKLVSHLFIASGTRTVRFTHFERAVVVREAA